MRKTLADLPSAAPVGLRLPGVLQEDELLLRFVRAFDDGFAPILVTLDGLAAYVDPRLAPEDFVDWLAAWVGIDVDDEWTLEQRRAIVAQAAGIHRRRGTARGVADAVRLVVVADVEVEETGGTDWSAAPGSALPGSAEPRLVVRVRCDRPGDVDARRLDAVVAAVKPAHVPHQVELVGPAGAEAAPSGGEAGPEGVPPAPDGSAG